MKEEGSFLSCVLTMSVTIILAGPVHSGNHIWFQIPVLLSLLEPPSFFLRNTSSSWTLTSSGSKVQPWSEQGCGPLSS